MYDTRFYNSFAKWNIRKISFQFEHVLSTDQFLIKEKKFRFDSLSLPYVVNIIIAWYECNNLGAVEYRLYS